jgi:hypothetical protein
MHELLGCFLDVRNTITTLQLRSIEGNAPVVDLDLMFIGATNRVCSLVDGFKLMIESQLYFCAIALMRMQLDNLLRMYAFKLVDNPNDTALQVRLGTKLSDLKSRTGERLLDSYLCKKYSENVSDINELYQFCSGYVHLSGRHISAAITNVNQIKGTVEFKIGTDIQYFSESEIAEMITTFLQLTQQYASLMEDWYASKARQLKPGV